MPLTHAECGRLGARKVNESRSPDQRRDAARHAYLIGAVRTVVGRMADLAPDQRDELRTALAGEPVTR